MNDAIRDSGISLYRALKPIVDANPSDAEAFLHVSESEAHLHVTIGDMVQKHNQPVTSAFIARAIIDILANDTVLEGIRYLEMFAMAHWSEYSSFSSVEDELV